MWTTRDNSARRPLVRVTRRYRFAAAHRLHADSLSDEQNCAVYGKCNNPFGHGHDYVMDVTVRGEMDPRLGRLIAIEQLDAFVHRVVVEPMDRRDLNRDVPEFATLVPTTENLAKVVAARVAAAWPAAFPGSPAIPEKVKIWETKRNIFEVFVTAADGGRQGAQKEQSEARLVEESR